jgi:hypothetical protein
MFLSLPKGGDALETDLLKLLCKVLLLKVGKGKVEGGAWRAKGCDCIDWGYFNANAS